MQLIECNATGYQCEERVVTTYSDASTWVVACAALAHDDVAWNNCFATEFLNTEAF